ncbi:6-phosphofructokinase [Parendozoicomonas haliclonae]|uniref:ATP-dependent 6-phosphofructokinase n=2 Tax=Parendozoicomonas haliclonae TaxID=1960125 RepID=A0A1X7AQ17_9GAMM|nr:6-phosphofructokinase [Parendozoicomonas haliclonae]SMA50335.1 6-phosphofructokinase isozyme 1 [Parendozoicomonas haliclonae]
MGKSLKHIGVLTSGGDAPGMNAAIRSVVRTCTHHGIEVTGFYEGYQGVIDDNAETLDARAVAHIINRGGTMLRSARCAEFRTREGRQKAYDNLKKRGIEGLVVIGGDGSFTGASLLSDEFDIPVIGIPGTIDNDIYGTDFTIGFDTALNTVVDAVDRIRDTATSHNRLFFIEVMGRDSGFIALNAGIAVGATNILIPEESTELDEVITKLKTGRENGKTSSIVLVAEGEKMGDALFMAEETKKHLPDYDIRVSVLGHMQRGGNPTCADRVLATRLGVAAVEQLMAGHSSVMCGVRNGSVCTVSIHDAISRKPGIDRNLMHIAEIVSL